LESAQPARARHGGGGWVRRGSSGLDADWWAWFGGVRCCCVDVVVAGGEAAGRRGEV
jgi:hypothetical protein